MAKIYYDRDADLSLIRKKKVAVLGLGKVGHLAAELLAEAVRPFEQNRVIDRHFALLGL